MTPYFSVIIPAYNCGNLIGETLDSAIPQEFTDFEIIIVNDGSTDNTSEILNHYQRRYPNRIQLVEQENKGEGGARNTGIHLAKGKYIALLDQDDLWFPWTLQTYFSVLEENASPAILIGSGKEFGDRTVVNLIGREKVMTRCSKDFLSLATYPYIPAGTPGTVVRTDEARRVGGLSTERVVGIDQEFFFKLGDAPGLVQVLSPTTVAIRRHSGNLQRNIAMGAKGALYIIEKESMGCYPGGEERRWSRRGMLARMLRTISVQCLGARYFEEAWQIYRRTFVWQIRLCRLKYLLGFPVIYMYQRARRLGQMKYVVLVA